MNRSKKIQYNLNAGLEYLLAFLMVINGRAVYAYLSNVSRLNTKIFYSTVIVIIGCIFTRNIIYTKRLKLAIIIDFILACYYLAYTYIKPYNRTSFMYFFVVLLLLILYYFACNKRSEIPSILFRYENIILGIAIGSLLFWLLGSVLHILNPSGNVYSSWSDSGDYKKIKNYYYLYYEIQRMRLPFFSNIKFIRNSAIFTEAPMASLHFCIAFLVELCCKENYRKWKIAILVIAILTTISYTGYSLIFLSLLILFMQKKSRSRLVYVFRLMVIPITLILTIGGLYLILRQKVGSGSGIIRIDDFIVGLKAWRRHFIFGGGFGNTDYLVSFMGAWRAYNIGFSNSIMYLFALGGIYFSLPFIACWIIGISNILKINDLRKKIFVLSILFLYVVTFITYQYIAIFLFLCMLEISYWQRKKY